MSDYEQSSTGRGPGANSPRREMDLFDIVAFIGCGRGQNDVGMARGGGPLKVVDDKGIEVLPGAHHLVAVLVVGERIATDPIGKLDFRKRDLCSVEIHHLARVQQRFHKARDRDRRVASRRQPGCPVRDRIDVPMIRSYRSLPFISARKD